MSLDRPTLEAQLHLLTTNHNDVISQLQQRVQKMADLQKQMEGIQREIEQYQGAVSYSQHIQEQTKKLLEQTVAAEMAAKLSAESAARNMAAEPIA